MSPFTGHFNDSDSVGPGVSINVLLIHFIFVNFSIFLTITPLRQGSLGTFTFFRGADISSEEDYRMMHGAFLIFTQELFQFFIGLFWSSGFHDSHSIHHAMDMCIDADKRHIVEMREDDFCCLDADSGESLHIQKHFHTFVTKSIKSI